MLDKFSFIKGTTFNTIHIVFDCQNPAIITPKSLEQCRRDQNFSTGTEYSEIKDSAKLPSETHTFLQVRHNKAKFVNYLSEIFVQLAKEILEREPTLIIGGGFKEVGIVKFVIKSRECDAYEFKNNHIEADTAVFLHVIKSTSDKVVIYSPDNDVYTIGLPIAQKISWHDICYLL